MKDDVAKLQGDVLKLQSDNAALRQQVAEMQTALDQFKAEQTAARQKLIDNVAAMIAAANGSTKTTQGKKKKAAVAPDPDRSVSIQETSSTAPGAPGLAPPPDPASGRDISAAENSGAGDENLSPPAKPQKGYYHIVASGETLTLICNAYRDKGVKVTVSEIRRANGLTEESTLKTGQKLFIPKPESDL